MVMTPSWPTFSMASEISWPMVSSPEDTAPTRAMSAEPFTFWLLAFMASMAAAVALAMPFFMIMGLAPAARFFRPSFTMA